MLALGRLAAMWRLGPYRHVGDKLGALLQGAGRKAVLFARDVESDFAPFRHSSTL